MTNITIFCLCFILFTQIKFNGIQSTSLIPKYLKQSAFCTSKSSRNDHPLPPSEIQLPWVWEAVYDEKLNTVEIIAISPYACSFNHTLWNTAVKLFPQYSKQLADGNSSNILVKSIMQREYDMIGRWSRIDGLLGKKVLCVYHGEDNQILRKISSRTIKGHPTWTSISTIHIYCPAPKGDASLMWNAVSLVKFTSTTTIRKIRLFHPNNRHLNETSKFPVCNAPYHTLSNKLRIKDHSTIHFQSSTDNLASDPPIVALTSKLFDVAICTASMGNSREHLVEWIEYHKLLGVNHFFIYNTATNSSHNPSLESLLHDYMDEGLVTVIPWPYLNCVRYMHSGRVAYWNSPDNGTQQIFQPPRAISQTAALASCYARFKNFTKYMIHIDDDEFLSVLPFHSQQSSSNGTSSQIHFEKDLILSINLKDFADEMFRLHPKSPAISFRCVDMMDCPVRQWFDSHSPNDSFAVNDPIKSSSTLPTYPGYNYPRMLPRLDRWTYMIYALVHDGKLLMRTDAVGSFFVHYISSYQSPSSKALGLANKNQFSWEGIVFPPFKLAALLHYKKPAHISNSIFGTSAPLPINYSSIDSNSCNKKETTRMMHPTFSPIYTKVCRENRVNGCQLMFCVAKNEIASGTLSTDSTAWSTDEYHQDSQSLLHDVHPTAQWCQCIINYNASITTNTTCFVKRLHYKLNSVHAVPPMRWSDSESFGMKQFYSSLETNKKDIVLHHVDRRLHDVLVTKYLNRLAIQLKG